MAAHDAQDWLSCSPERPDDVGIKGHVAFRFPGIHVRDVYLVGVGQTPVNRDAAVRGRHLAATAVAAALEHGAVDKAAVDALFVGNMTGGILGRQQQLGGLIADYSGLSGIEAVNVEAACASGAAATRMAFLMIAGGVHDVAVVCGVERMTHADRETVTRALATAADWELEGSKGESFLSLNAQLMRAYMKRYGSRPEDFAPFAINAHHNAMTNPNAALHKEIDLDDYLTSRIIVDPVRLYDVSPVCNGSAAIVLASADVAANFAGAAGARVRIAASSAATAPLALSRRADALRLDAVASSTRELLANAGMSLDDIDLFELHDAYTIMSVLCLEAAGFAAPGAGTALGRDGRIALDGDLPLSTMGGLKARGHPVGATGVYQIVESFLQLTRQAGANQVADARIALVQNIGGTAATVVNHLLERTA
jgi:acetyl-CoA C-acetyltransferase